jgi:hypothetical protein
MMTFLPLFPLKNGLKRNTIFIPLRATVYNRQTLGGTSAKVCLLIAL